MSRAAFYDALITDPVLNSYGINQDTVFSNWNNEERPSNATPFVIIRWGTQAKPVFYDVEGSVKAPDNVTVWVHWPKEISTEFSKLTKILDQIDNVFVDTRNVAGTDGNTLSYVTVGDRSADLIDEGFNTITKYGVYQVYSRKSS